MVIVGILGEGVELLAKLGRRKDFKKWFGERLNPRLLTPFAKLTIPDKLWIEGISLYLVAAGLLIEVGASHEVYSISDSQNASLNREAADAWTNAASAIYNAGVATNLAAQANERAVKFDLARAEAENETALTRSNNLVLQTRVEMLQARRIGVDQEKKFIELLKNKPVSPIKIFVGDTDGETDDYANEIKTMLDAATGKTNEIIELGNVRHPSRIGETVEDVPFLFLFYETNNETILPPGAKLTYTTPNSMYEGIQMTHYLAYPNTASWEFNVVNDAFQKIGIYPVGNAENKYLKPGEWGIFVPKKF
jgi:hypothetical protein